MSLLLIQRHWSVIIACAETLETSLSHEPRIHCVVQGLRLRDATRRSLRSPRDFASLAMAAWLPMPRQ